MRLQLAEQACLLLNAKKYGCLVQMNYFLFKGSHLDLSPAKFSDQSVFDVSESINHLIKIGKPDIQQRCGGKPVSPPPPFQKKSPVKSESPPPNCNTLTTHES